MERPTSGRGAPYSQSRIEAKRVDGVSYRLRAGFAARRGAVVPFYWIETSRALVDEPRELPASPEEVERFLRSAPCRDRYPVLIGARVVAIAGGGAAAIIAEEASC